MPLTFPHKLHGFRPPFDHLIRRKRRRAGIKLRAILQRALVCHFATVPGVGGFGIRIIGGLQDLHKHAGLELVDARLLGLLLQEFCACAFEVVCLLLLFIFIFICFII